MISVFPVHLKCWLLSIFGRSGMYLPIICPVAWFLLVLIPQRRLKTESAISRRVLHLYLEMVWTSLIWAHFRKVRRFFIKSSLLPFPAESQYTVHRRKENSIRGGQFCLLLVGISYYDSKTFASHASFSSKYNLKNLVVYSSTVLSSCHILPSLTPFLYLCATFEILFLVMNPYLLL